MAWDTQSSSPGSLGLGPVPHNDWLSRWGGCVVFYHEFPLSFSGLKLLHPTDKLKCLFQGTSNFPSDSVFLGNLHVPRMEVHSGSQGSLMNAREWICTATVQTMNLHMNLETQLIHILRPSYMLSQKAERFKRNPFLPYHPVSLKVNLIRQWLIRP